MNQFLLMHKDSEVAIVSIISTKNTYYLHVDELINSFYLPFGVKNSTPEDIDELLTSWLDFRCTIPGRSDYYRILDELDISSNVEMIQYSYQCSLVDCYWFKRVDEAISWHDVNFRTHGLHSNLNDMLFYGMDIKINNYNSPDITTDGALPKTWIERNGDFILLKGNRKSTIEACYEVIAHLIFTDLGIDHIPYCLDNTRGIVSSACKCIIQSDEEELVPIENLMKDYNCVGQANFLPVLRDLGFGNELNAMFLGDVVIGNIDRHARNYCVIVDSETQEIKRFAPLFDQGGCHLCENHGFLTYPPTGVSFNKTVPMIPKERLASVKNINVDRIAEAIQDMPLDDYTKEDIMIELNNRIQKLISFSKLK